MQGLKGHNILRLPEKKYRNIIHDLKALYGLNNCFLKRYHDISLPIRMKII